MWLGNNNKDSYSECRIWQVSECTIWFTLAVTVLKCMLSTTSIIFMSLFWSVRSAYRKPHHLAWYMCWQNSPSTLKIFAISLLLPSTEAYNLLIREREEKAREIWPDFYATDAMLYRDWTRAGYDLRHIVTRLPPSPMQDWDIPPADGPVCVCTMRKGLRPLPCLSMCWKKSVSD